MEVTAENIGSASVGHNTYLENVVNHRHNVLNCLISGNVRHQIQKCTCTLLAKRQTHRRSDTFEACHC